MKTPEKLSEDTANALQQKYGKIFVSINRGAAYDESFVSQLIAMLSFDMDVSGNRREVLEIFCSEARDKSHPEVAEQVLLHLAARPPREALTLAFSDPKLEDISGSVRVSLPAAAE